MTKLNGGERIFRCTIFYVLIKEEETEIVRQTCVRLCHELFDKLQSQLSDKHCQTLAVFGFGTFALSTLMLKLRSLKHFSLNFSLNFRFQLFRETFPLSTESYKRYWIEMFNGFTVADPGAF
jgi:hypothetical protein